MNAARVVIVAGCLVAVAACQTQTDPTTGRTVMSTPTIGQLFGLQPGASTEVASTRAEVGSDTEHYRQQLSEKTTDLSLTPLGGGQWEVTASMLAQPTCVGSVQGRAVEQSPGLLVMSNDAQGNRCSIQIRRGDGTASIGELDCMSDHGASCEFSADMTRTN